jgi:beta-mannanase
MSPPRPQGAERGAVRGRFYATVPWLLAAVIGGLIAAQVGLSMDGSSSGAAKPIEPDRRAHPRIGLTTAELAQNSFSPWRGSALDGVDKFERAVRARADVVMWYADWANVRRPDIRQLRVIALRGSVPEITWEPWNHAWHSARQPTYRLRRIIEGRHDGLIRRWARALAAYGGPVRLRFAHEMNGNWYPWSEAANRNRPRQFAKAWRHVWRIFKREGASNVEWVWSPVALKIPKLQYPGDAYVDRVGLSGFVGGVQLQHNRWRSFMKVFGPALRRFARIAPRKPIEISEVGAAEEGGDKAKWIRGMFRSLAHRSKIDSVIWFDLDKGSDWRIQSSSKSVRAFRAGVRNRLRR